jgi:hypothetical protein
MSKKDRAKEIKEENPEVYEERKEAITKKEVKRKKEEVKTKTVKYKWDSSKGDYVDVETGEALDMSKVDMESFLKL